METWDLVRQQWWFDETYLGQSTAPLEECFELLGQYSKFPRHRGSGHLVESWVKTSKLSAAAGSALEALQKLIDSTN